MAWIAGAAALGGAALKGMMDKSSASSANQMSAESVDKMIAFQDEQSRSGWQRAATDMKLAGLNPMLAYSQGPNQSMGGSSYQAQWAQRPDMGQAAVTGYATAAQAKNVQADTANKEAQQGLIRAQTIKEVASAGQLDALKAKNEKELNQLDAEISRTLADMGLKNALARNEQLRAETLNQEQYNALKYFAARTEEAIARAKIASNDVPESVRKFEYWASELSKYDIPAQRLGAGIGALGKTFTPKLPKGTMR